MDKRINQCYETQFKKHGAKYKHEHQIYIFSSAHLSVQTVFSPPCKSQKQHLTLKGCHCFLSYHSYMRQNLCGSGRCDVTVCFRVMLCFLFVWEVTKKAEVHLTSCSIIFISSSSSCFPRFALILC